MRAHSSQLGETEIDAQAVLASLARELPLPIAQCLHEYGVTGRNDALFFAVESALRLMSAMVKSAYLTRPCRPSARFNDLIRQCLLHPSMGSWWTFLDKARGLMESGEVPTPFPELAPLLARLPADDILRVITLRNHAYGHVGSPPTPEMDELVAAELVPRVARMLACLSCLTRYPLVVFDEQAGNWLRCMGPTPAVESHAPSIPVNAPAAMLSIEGGDLALFPLILGSFDGYAPALDVSAREIVLVFDGVDLDGKRLVYVGRHGRGHGKRWFEEYRRRLEDRRVPVLPFKADELPGPELLERLRGSFLEVHGQARMLGQIHGDVDRLDPAAAGAIDDAIVSSARIAFVSGEAGIGKSTHLLAAGLRSTRREHVTIYVDARSAFADPARTFREALRVTLEAQLGLLGASERLLGLAQEALRAVAGDDARIVLILDGLDEIGAPPRVKSLLGELRDWLLRRSAELPCLRVLLAARSAYLEALQRLGDPLASVSQLLYRPTRKGSAGHDVVEGAIWLTPPGPNAMAEVGQRYEGYRARSGAHRPLTPFAELAPDVQHSCRNPRWMVRLLSTFDGREVPFLQGSFDLWNALLDEWVYPLVGGPGGPRRPLFPKRIRLVDALVREQLRVGHTSVALRELEADKDAGPLVRQDSGHDELTTLQSIGVLVVEGSDARDPFADVIVRPADDGLAVALLVNSRSFASSDPGSWVATTAEHGSGTLWGPLSEAMIISLTRRAARDGWSAIQPTLGALDEGIEAMVLLRALATEPWQSAAAGLLPSGSVERRDAVLRALLRLAWASGQQRRLAPVVEELAHAPNSDQTETSVEIVASILRHGEHVERGERWLNEVADQRPDLRGAALFHLAELLRDKGQWRKASRYYALVAAHGMSAARCAHALAGLGECEIWLKRNREALQHLREALERLGDADAPEVRCNIHLKRGIAARMVRRYPLAVSELLEAEALALRHNFRTEQAKLTLELGLVSAALGRHGEALDLIDQSLARHRAQGFVKGEKKATFCRGHVLALDGRREEALVSYRECLALNERYFDLLGLQLTHRALATLLSSTSPAEASQHQRKADQMKARLGAEDTPDEHHLL